MFRAACCLVLLTAASLAQGQPGTTPIATIQSLIRAQQYDQALQAIQASLQQAPKDPRLLTLEGIVFSIQGKTTEAIAAFDAALTVSPDDPAALRGDVQLLYRA